MSVLTALLTDVLHSATRCLSHTIISIYYNDNYHNKWSKNFDEAASHRVGGFFMGEKLI